MNKFGFTEQDLESNKSGIQPGIQENIKITNIVFETIGGKNNNQTPCLSFYFEDSLEGTSRIFESQVTDTFGEETRQKYQRWQNSRILQLMSPFMDRKDIAEKVGEAKTFQEFGKKVVEVIGDLYKDVPLRVKFVVNNKGYVTLPMPFKPFITLMTDSPSLITIDPKWDKLEAPTPDVESESTDGLLDLGEEASAEADDLDLDLDEEAGF